MTTRPKHATTTRDGFEVPLIGIPAEMTHHECECCGKICSLDQLKVSEVGQVLCEKCRQGEKP